MTASNKHKILLQNALFLILLCMTIYMFQLINNLQGTARVVNYAGIARGSIQRLIKLELSNQETDELIQYIDHVFYGLNHGSETLNLVKIPARDFEESLEVWQENWGRIKNIVEEEPLNSQQLLQVSEENFTLASVTVSDVEQYTQRIVDMMHWIEGLTIVGAALLLLLLMMESLLSRRLKKHNSELSEKAYLDLQTGLMNRNRCNELLSEKNMLANNVACVFCDLNNLKKVNDNLGHKAGDKLLNDFAAMLKEHTSVDDFLGRYGGDEFLIVMYNTTPERLQAFLEKLDQYLPSDRRDLDKLSFSYGYDVSWNYTQSTLEQLFLKADERMYAHKKGFKEEIAKKEL